MAGKQPGGRPLSPHLGVYKWAPSMAVSIFYRVTGDGLAIVGGLMLLWWLGALAAGPDAYAAFLACVWHAPSPEAGTLHQITTILGQIGRASCRERVCPYVSISVVAVALQKKANDQSTPIPF